MDPVAKFFEDYKFIAFIRSSSPEDAEEMIKAAILGGIHILEISALTPQAVRLIEHYSKKEGLVVGAGSVTDGELAQRAIKAGARFIASQFTDREIISVAKNNDCFVIQGGLTPTEAITAHQLGADMIKIYPAETLGGVEYIRTLKNAMPFLKLVVDGEATFENSFEYLKHCVAVTLRGAIFDRPLVRSDNWSEMAERARQFTQKLETSKVSR